jgi:hypothetical protein
VNGIGVAIGAVLLALTFYAASFMPANTYGTSQWSYALHSGSASAGKAGK